MTNKERQIARSELIEGLTVLQLIDDMEGKKYADLVIKQSQEIGTRLPETIVVHENLMVPEEVEAVREILTNLENKLKQPNFWITGAGDFLNSISCDLNDALFPIPAEDAGVFNLFQLITAKLADHALRDADFRHILLNTPLVKDVRSSEHGIITRKLGIAISDYDNGHISRKNLLAIFQEAIKNGDILCERNEQYVIANVLPLVDAGLLQSSEHIKTFEIRMNKIFKDLVNDQRTKENK